MKIIWPPFCFEIKIQNTEQQKVAPSDCEKMQPELSKSVENCRRRCKNRKSLPRKKITEIIGNNGFLDLFWPFVEKQLISTFLITFFTCITIDHSGGTKWARSGPNGPMLGPKWAPKGRENGVGRHHF